MNKIKCGSVHVANVNLAKERTVESANIARTNQNLEEKTL